MAYGCAGSSPAFRTKLSKGACHRRLFLFMERFFIHGTLEQLQMRLDTRFWALVTTERVLLGGARIGLGPIAAWRISPRPLLQLQRRCV